MRCIPFAARSLAGVVLLAPLIASAEPRARDGATDLRAALDDLDSASLDVRASAQRWLASHARTSDLVAFAARARDGGAAVRDGLAAVLGSADSLLGLSIELAVDVDAAVAAVGRAALVGQVARWSPALLTEPMPDGDVPPDWWRDRGLALAVDLSRGSLLDVVDRIDRLGGGPAPIVLDPLLHPGVRRGSSLPPPAPGRTTASWLELAALIVEVQGSTFRVHGIPPYDDRSLAEDEEADAAPRLAGASDDYEGDVIEGPRAAPFLLLAPKGRSSDASALERLGAWCETVAEPGDPVLREACARAIAATGWPAAAGWLAERWLATGDAAALEGTLVALARRRVVPSLVRSEVVRSLFREVDRRLAANEGGAQRFAERVARALAAMPAVDPSGVALGDDVLRGFGAADAVGQWARFVVLEGHGRLNVRAAREARAALGSPATLGPVALQALATFLVVSPPDADPPTVRRPESLLAAAHEAGLDGPLGAWLAASRAALVFEDDARVSFAALPHESRAALVRWGAAVGMRGDVPLPLLAVLRAEAADAAGRARLVATARTVREAGDGAALVRAAHGIFGDDVAMRACWLDAGLADAEERRAALDDARTGELETALALLPGLVADGELGAAARAELDRRVVAFVGAEHESGRDALAVRKAVTPMIDALRRASIALRRARLDREEDELFAGLRDHAGRRLPALAEALYAPDWPGLPPPPPADLDALERRFGR